MMRPMISAIAFDRANGRGHAAVAGTARDGGRA